jgi:hypothetical protein
VQKYLVPALFMIIVGYLGWNFYTYQKQSNSNSLIPKISPSPILPSSAEPVDFTASFEIYTNGTKRIFTAAMYHNQSEDVFIQNSDPSVIYVKKAGVTWADFFATLPFSLTKECLITGTQQTFCNTDTQKLRFFVNDTEVPDALILEIHPNDILRVTYGN